MNQELDDLFNQFCLQDENSRSKTFCQLQKVLSLYQENPFLLDKKLEFYLDQLQELVIDSFINQAKNEETCILSLKLIYYFVVVRGKRTVSLFLRHDLKNVWLLKHLQQLLLADVDWQVRSVSFLWLSQFLLLPFSFADGTQYSKSFFDLCAEIATEALSSNAPIQKIVGLFLGVVYSRPEYEIESLFCTAFQQSEHLIGTISLSPLKQTVFIEDFFTVVQQSLSAPELEIRVSAAESFAKILRSISSKQSAQILKHFMHYALDMQELPLKGPQELHGIIYALAEIIRQGIYQVVYELAEFFEQISLFWRHCLFFEARQTVVAPTQSALVRDTACYLAWAIAKFTRKQCDIQQLSSQIITDLVCIALFDSEVNCRRASAACLQQWIGRCDFAKGVELIQVINFNSISQGKSAFTELAKRISIEFPCLRVCLINHLLYVKRFHKDEDTRCLAAETFAFLFSNSPDKQEIAAVLQSDIRRHDPIVFHGSLYFYSSILNQLDDAEIILIDPSIPFISCSPYYALLIDSVLNYVVKLCETKKLDDNQVSSFLDVIFNICQSKNARNLSRPLWRKATFECLQLIVQKFTCNFGSIIEKYWQLFIETLHYPYFYIIASAGGISPSQQKSLLEIYKKSQVDLKIEILYAIKKSTSSANLHLYDLIAMAIEDYTIDHRGDIGSFVRMEALEIIFLHAKNEFYYENLFAKIFRICLEKMQKLHGVAWNIVLLYPQFQQIKHYFSILPDDSFDNFSVDFHSVIRVILEESGDVSKEALIGFLRAFTSNIVYIQEPIYRVIFDLFHQDSFVSLNKLIDKVVILPGMLLAKLVFLEYLLDKFSHFIQPDTIKQLLQESSIPPDNFKLNSVLINIHFLLDSIEPIKQMTLSSIPTLSSTAKQYLKLLSHQPYSD